MSLITEFRSLKRLEAKQSGQGVLERSPGGYFTTEVGLTKTRALVFADGKRLYAAGAGRPSLLDKNTARQLIVHTYGLEGKMDQLVFADRAALWAFRNLAGNTDQKVSDAAAYPCALKAFDLLAKVRFGLRLTVLTDVLRFRYWLGEGHDQHSIEGWAKAIGFPTASEKAIRDLEAMVRNSRAHVPWVPDNVVRQLGTTETSVVKGSTHYGTQNSIGLYRDLNALEAIIREIRLRAPGVQEEHTINGEITRVTTVGGTELIPLMATSSSKLGADKRVYGLDSSGIVFGQGVIHSMGMRNGALELVWAGKNRSTRWTPANGDSAYLMEIPFKPMFLAFKNKRWIGRDTQGATEGRSVPMDVTLGGVPVA